MLVKTSKHLNRLNYRILQDCLRPEGAKVGWIQCDKCEKWYHLECVALSNKEAEQIEDYTCPVCVNTT